MSNVALSSPGALGSLRMSHYRPEAHDWVNPYFVDVTNKILERIAGVHSNTLKYCTTKDNSYSHRLFAYCGNDASGSVAIGEGAENASYWEDRFIVSIRDISGKTKTLKVFGDIAEFHLDENTFYFVDESIFKPVTPLGGLERVKEQELYNEAERWITNDPSAQSNIQASSSGKPSEDPSKTQASSSQSNTQAGSNGSAGGSTQTNGWGLGAGFAAGVVVGIVGCGLYAKTKAREKDQQNSNGLKPNLSSQTGKFAKV